ncbi:hypothetical protein K4K61_006922 [Colletotrichum sp. SAR11_59]|nr:hypothetical protein K4K61_006922 [Colletotrichum sp. SAR11_59]
MNIAIANHGSNTEASWGPPPHAHGSGDDETPPLRDQLEAAMCTTLPLGAADPARSFLPDDELHRLVTPASALRTLRECAPGHPEEIRSIFAQTIFNKSPALIKNFAILVLIGRADAIFKFMDNSISDGDLPLEPTVEGGTLVRSQSTNKVFDLALAGLGCDEVVAFEEMQWRVCVPVMDELGAEDKPRQLHPKTILPFIWDGPVAPMIQQGGYSRVYQVNIHPAHHHFGASENHTRFAVKQLTSPSDTAFSREVSALKSFSDAPNIIKLLTAFKHGPIPYLILPWADTDLHSLWARTDAPAEQQEQQTILAAKQMLGVAEALKAIHYCRVKNRNANRAPGTAVQGYHADLKPENILVMDGRWTLSDFGLSSARPPADGGAADRPLGCSPTYRAPEHDVGRFDGQKADIWSLGCVMSVAATWMALGRKGVRSFRAKRAVLGNGASGEDGKVDDSFFEARKRGKGNELRVKPAVTHWIDKLRQSPTASPYIHDLLDLVKNDMLEVDSNKRIDSDQLVGRLREMHRKCSDEPEYARPDPRAPKRAADDDAGDDGLDDTQWGKIQERNRGMEGAAKWAEIYKTIFPLDGVPSPYRDEQPSGLTRADFCSEFRNFIAAQFPGPMSAQEQRRMLHWVTEFETHRSLTQSSTASGVPSLVVDECDSRCDTTITASSFESPIFTDVPSPSLFGCGVGEDVGFGVSPCAPGMPQPLSFGHDFPLFPQSPHVEMGASWQAPSFPPVPGLAAFDGSEIFPDGTSDSAMM